MDFADITLGTLSTIRQLLLADGRETSEYALSYTFPWRSPLYSVQFAQASGCGVYKFKFWGREYFSYPFGPGDKKAACAEVESLARGMGLKTKFAPVTRAEAESLGDGYLLRPLPAIADYIYRTRDLAELKGGKYQQKRNHIHRFEELGPWRYGDIDADACRQVLAAWLAGHPVDAELEAELEALDRILTTPDFMGLKGGVLYLNERPVGFALGEPLSERMYLASYEKAIPSIQGAFPMVTREFARREAAGYEYLNRAPADGHPNLEKAKRSFHPAFMGEKFAAVQSRARFATPADFGLVVKLWRESFGDNEATVRYFIERKFTGDNCLLIDDLAMAFCLEDGDTRYLYALCTAPEARGRGLATELVNTARQLYAEPLVTVPGDSRLVPFYEKLGFKITAPAVRRKVELDEFAQGFYRLATGAADPQVWAELPTMTSPGIPGYVKAVPLN